MTPSSLKVVLVVFLVVLLVVVDFVVAEGLLDVVLGLDVVAEEVDEEEGGAQ